MGGECPESEEDGERGRVERGEERRGREGSHKGDRPNQRG